MPSVVGRPAVAGLQAQELLRLLGASESGALNSAANGPLREGARLLRREVFKFHAVEVARVDEDDLVSLVAELLVHAKPLPSELRSPQASTAAARNEFKAECQMAKTPKDREAVWEEHIDLLAPHYPRLAEIVLDREPQAGAAASLVRRPPGCFQLRLAIG